MVKLLLVYLRETEQRFLAGSGTTACQSVADCSQTAEMNSEPDAPDEEGPD